MIPDSRTHDFDTPNPVRLRVEIPKGRIRIVAEDVAKTHVELTAIRGDITAREWIADAEIDQHGDDVVVRIHKTSILFLGLGGGVDALVRVPTGSSACLGSGSGRVETQGRLGEVEAATGSGRIELSDVAEAHVRTGSGDIAIHACAGTVDARAGSGRISVGKVGGDARITTASGRAEVESVAGDARVRAASGNIEVGAGGESIDAFTASGNVDIHRVDHGRVRARTVSGKVCVGVARGTAALLDVSTMSGRVFSDLDSGAPAAGDEKSVELILSSVSGNVAIGRA